MHANTWITVDKILDGLTPTQPMDTSDSIAIWELLRPIVQLPNKLDIMHDKTAIHIRVYDGRGLMVYERKLVAS